MTPAVEYEVVPNRTKTILGFWTAVVAASVAFFAGFAVNAGFDQGVYDEHCEIATVLQLDWEDRCNDSAVNLAKIVGYSAAAASAFVFTIVLFCLWVSRDPYRARPRAPLRE